MTRSFAMLPILLFTVFLSVAAKPIAIRDHVPVSLPFLLRLSQTNITLPDLDRTRAKALRTQGINRIIRSSLSNVAAKNLNFKRDATVPVEVLNSIVTYSITVGVGSPPTNYSLIIDTGSSNTWIGADTPYEPTSTSVDTGLSVSVTYGSGDFSGQEFLDTVTLAPDLVIPGQSIGVAAIANGFDGTDGILGIGPVELTIGTLSDESQAIPTVTDSLFEQGTIAENIVGVSFNPLTGVAEENNGVLTFGGVDEEHFVGNLSFVPITETAPASAFWGVDQTVTFGNGSDSETVLSLNAGIVDTGTTLVLLATDAFDVYQQLTGAELDIITGLLQITEDQFAALQSLFFNIGDQSYELTPNAQIWPRQLNTVIGGQEDAIYLVVSDLGTPSGQGLDFINGYTFLERFYTAYDTTNRQIGFATTVNTNAETN